MTSPTPALLEVRRLTKYYGRYIGCRGIDFTLRPGEVLAVVGESGSGKTMFLRSVVGAFALADVTRTGTVALVTSARPDKRPVAGRTGAARAVALPDMPYYID